MGVIICCYKSILIFSDFKIGCAFSDSGANKHLLFPSLSAQKKIIVKPYFLICISLGNVRKHTLSNAEQTLLHKVMLTTGKRAGIYNSIHLSSSINLTVFEYLKGGGREWNQYDAYSTTQGTVQASWDPRKTTSFAWYFLECFHWGGLSRVIN